jgi:LacI family transcriptional regulator
MPNGKEKAKDSPKGAIVVSLPFFNDMFESYFVIEIMKGVGKGIENSGYSLQLHIFGSDMDEEAIRKHLINVPRLSGALFADVDGNKKIVAMLKKNKIPYVIMNNIFDDNETNCIGIDNRAVAREAVEHLIKLGHKAIATITGNINTQSGIMRLEGYKEALAKNKIAENPEYIVIGEYHKDTAQEGMVKLINVKPRPTAIFIASDLMAFGAIMIALKKDIKIPEDISIVGFDNSPIAALGHVTITTINQPLAEMGMTATKALIDIIEGKKQPPFKKVLSAKLVMGSSCRKI